MASWNQAKRKYSRLPTTPQTFLNNTEQDCLTISPDEPSCSTKQEQADESLREKRRDQPEEHEASGQGHHTGEDVGSATKDAEVKRLRVAHLHAYQQDLTKKNHQRTNKQQTTTPLSTERQQSTPRPVTEPVEDEEEDIQIEGVWGDEDEDEDEEYEEERNDISISISAPSDAPLGDDSDSVTPAMDVKHAGSRRVRPFTPRSGDQHQHITFKDITGNAAGAMVVETITLAEDSLIFVSEVPRHPFAKLCELYEKLYELACEPFLSLHAVFTRHPNKKLTEKRLANAMRGSCFMDMGIGVGMLILLSSTKLDSFPCLANSPNDLYHRQQVISEGEFVRYYAYLVYSFSGWFGLHLRNYRSKNVRRLSALVLVWVALLCVYIAIWSLVVIGYGFDAIAHVRDCDREVPIVFASSFSIFTVLLAALHFLMCVSLAIFIFPVPSLPSASSFSNTCHAFCNTISTLCCYHNRSSHGRRARRRRQLFHDKTPGKPGQYLQAGILATGSTPRGENAGVVAMPSPPHGSTGLAG